jgi:hypothetical protein
MAQIRGVITRKLQIEGRIRELIVESLLQNYPIMQITQDVEKDPDR